MALGQWDGEYDLFLWTYFIQSINSRRTLPPFCICLKWEKYQQDTNKYNEVQLNCTLYKPWAIERLKLHSQIQLIIINVFWKEITTKTELNIWLLYWMCFCFLKSIWSKWLWNPYIFISRDIFDDKSIIEFSQVGGGLRVCNQTLWK